MLAKNLFSALNKFSIKQHIRSLVVKAVNRENVQVSPSLFKSFRKQLKVRLKTNKPLISVSNIRTVTIAGWLKHPD